MRYKQALSMIFSTRKGILEKLTLKQHTSIYKDLKISWHCCGALGTETG